MWISSSNSLRHLLLSKPSYLKFLYVDGVLPACVFVYHMDAWWPRRPEESAEAIDVGAGVPPRSSGKAACATSLTPEVRILSVKNGNTPANVGCGQVRGGARLAGPCLHRTCSLEEAEVVSSSSMEYRLKSGRLSVTR